MTARTTVIDESIRVQNRNVATNSETDPGKKNGLEAPIARTTAKEQDNAR
jgi:hypothetical protein